jgi:hypothetical protein
VLSLLAEGFTNAEIGARLHLSEKTVKNYVGQALHHLGMTNRTQAALYWVSLSNPPRDGTCGMATCAGHRVHGFEVCARHALRIGARLLALAMVDAPRTPEELDARMRAAQHDNGPHPQEGAA